MSETNGKDATGSNSNKSNSNCNSNSNSNDNDNTANCSSASAPAKNLRATTTRGMSESSTTSDNTTEFIDIVKKYDVVYNTQNPDYKNVEVKMKVWTQIAEEIGLSVDASKRKWKNLRDSYTKYLRSFRTGTKTSKKYQYWAHADHMEFLKPYQGPGRNLNTPVNASKTNEEEDTTEGDSGFQLIAKTSNNLANGVKSEDEQQPAAVPVTIPASVAASMPTPVPTSTVEVTSSSNQTISNAKQLGAPLSNAVATATITVPTIATSSSAPAASSSVSQASAMLLSSALPSTISSSFLASSAPTIATIPPTMNINTTAAIPTSLSNLQTPSSLTSNHLNLLPLTSSAAASLTAVSASLSSLANPLSLLPIPSLPTVQLPPQLGGKSLLASLPLPPTSSGATPLLPQIFPLPSNGNKPSMPPLPPAIGNNGAAGNVGCFILEPHLFASADAFKKELSTAALNLMNSLSCSTAPTATFSTPLTKVNPPPSTPTLTNAASMTKIRRVQPSPQTTAINLSLNGNNNNHQVTNPISVATTTTATTTNTATSAAQPADAKARKAIKRSAEIDIGAILQANRDLDANTLFFLSLSKTVRAMPTKFQSLAKMRCMRIVSDLELELENMDLPIEEQIANGSNKFCSIDSPSPPDATAGQNPLLNSISESTTEHFVYVMSPSRVENMIDLSSDDEATAT